MIRLLGIKRMGLSAAMTSKHVQHIEAQVGARLLNRTSRNVSLTEAGVMVDTFNLWEDVAAADWLRENGSRVAGVHVGDVPADASPGRDLPGTNGGRTRELVEAAHAGGWNGTLDVEIFSTPDGFWGLPVDEAARHAHGAASRLLA